jgi:hypothetical protein
MEQDFKNQLESISDADLAKYREMRTCYDQLVELLTLAQYKHLMGGDMTYVDKVARAKKVSKSKKVHALANKIIALNLEIKGA